MTGEEQHTERSPEEQAQLDQELLDLFLKAQEENGGVRILEASVRTLLEKGANPNTREFGDHGRYLTELLFTAKKRNTFGCNVLKILLNYGAEADPELEDGGALIVKAARSLAFNAVEMLKEKGAPAATATDEFGRNLLFYEWIPNHIMKLLNVYGVDPTHKDNDGLAPAEFHTDFPEEYAWGNQRGFTFRTIASLEAAADAAQQIEQGDFSFSKLMETYCQHIASMNEDELNGFLDVVPGVISRAAEQGLVSRDDLLGESHIRTLSILMGSVHGTRHMLPVVLDIAQNEGKPLTFEEFKILDHNGALFSREENVGNTGIELEAGKQLMRHVLGLKPEWPDFFEVYNPINGRLKRQLAEGGVATTHQLDGMRKAWLDKVQEHLTPEDLHEMDPELRKDLMKSGFWPMLSLIKADERDNASEKAGVLTR